MERKLQSFKDAHFLKETFFAQESIIHVTHVYSIATDVPTHTRQSSLPLRQNAEILRREKCFFRV